MPAVVYDMRAEGRLCKFKPTLEESCAFLPVLPCICLCQKGTAHGDQHPRSMGTCGAEPSHLLQLEAGLVNQTPADLQDLGQYMVITTCLWNLEVISLMQQMLPRWAGVCWCVFSTLASQVFWSLSFLDCFQDLDLDLGSITSVSLYGNELLIEKFNYLINMMLKNNIVATFLYKN